MRKILLSTFALAMTSMSVSAQARLVQQMPQDLLTVPQMQAAEAAAAAKGTPELNSFLQELVQNCQPGMRTPIANETTRKALRKAAKAALSKDFLLYGTVMNNDEWPIKTVTDPETGESYTYQESEYDLYTYDGDVLEALETGMGQYMTANGGGTIAGKEYVYNYYMTFMGSMAYNLYFAYDLETGEIGMVNCGDDYTAIANQVAFDATTGQVYGQFYNARRTGYVWGTRDIELGSTAIINDMPGVAAFRALAFDPYGRAFAIDMNNNLLRIDKQTGYVTVIGPTNLPELSNNIMSGAIEPKTGIFYFVAQLADNSTVLYEINLTTGQASKVKDMPGNAMVAGAAFAPVQYSEAVPAAAEALTLNFDREALNGTLSFTAPAKTLGGQGAALTEVAVTLDGAAYKTVRAAAGETVTMDVAVAETGRHTWQVVAKNVAGAGQPATIDRWVGLDLPEAVGNLTITNIDYNNALIAWDAPKVGKHGGYIDPEKLNYTIMSSAGSYEAKNQKETQIVVKKTGNTLATRSYTVTANSDEEAGLTAQTDRIYFGKPYNAPRSFDFESQAEFNLWWVIDANGDYKTWSYNPGGKYASTDYSRDNAADDYLFSPPLHMTPDQYYDLTSTIAAEMAYYQEAYEIGLYKTQRIDGLVKELQGPTYTEKTGEQSRLSYHVVNTFRVEEEGDYFIGYHCISPVNQLRLELHDVSFKKGSAPDSPAAVTDLTLTPDPDGKKSVDVSFTAPTLDTEGNAVKPLTKAEVYVAETLVKTLTDIVAGQKYSVHLSGEVSQGYNDFTVFIYNESGKGLPAKGTVFVGTDIPGKPQNVHMEANDNSLFISWDAPTIGANGGYINPADLTYSLVRQADRVEVYNGAQTQGYDYDINWYGEQEQVTYGIFAINSTGWGPGAPSHTYISGDAYLMPFEETFGPSSDSHIWLLGYTETPSASINNDNEVSYDDDGYSLYCRSYRAGGGNHCVSTGKIFINKRGNAALRFAVRGEDPNNRIQVGVSTNGILEESLPIGETTVGDGDWKIVGISLQQYAGQEIMINFRGFCEGETTLWFDTVIVDNNGLGDAEDMATGIDTVLAPTTDNRSYDLWGRPVNRAAQQGVTIVNGKKVVR